MWGSLPSLLCRHHQTREKSRPSLAPALPDSPTLSAVRELLPPLPKCSCVHGPSVCSTLKSSPSGPSSGRPNAGHWKGRCFQTETPSGRHARWVTLDLSGGEGAVGTAIPDPSLPGEFLRLPRKSSFPQGRSPPLILLNGPVSVPDAN